jgi:hypothetical protein
VSTGDALTRNAKAVISAVGGALSVAVAATALFQYAPASFAGPGTAVLAVLEVLRTANVWLVRNEPLLDDAVTVAGQLVNQVQAPAAVSMSSVATDDRHV